MSGEGAILGKKKGVLPPQPTKGSEHPELSQRDQGQSLGRKRISMRSMRYNASRADVSNIGDRVCRPMLAAFRRRRFGPL